MAAEPVLIVTRPREQAAPWVERLRAKGVTAGAVPLLEIRPGASEQSLHEAWRGLAAFSVVMFVSPNAVAHFFGGAGEGAPRSWPQATWAAAPGHGTARALIDLGVPPDRILQPPPDAQQFDSESLWPVMAALPWAGRRALIVRGDGGREWLSEQLRLAGATVEHLSVYQRSAPQLLPAEQALLQAAWRHPWQSVWLFSSSEALGHLPSLLADHPPAEVARWAAESLALTTHPRILEQARRLGFKRAGRLPPRPG